MVNVRAAWLVIGLCLAIGWNAAARAQPPGAALPPIAATQQSVEPSTQPATQPAVAGAAHFPHLEIDVAHRQLRIDCEVLHADMPLEFLCVQTGGNEYESLLRSAVLPEHVHLGLLMLGLKPGHPARFDAAAGKWLPPDGSPLDISLGIQSHGTMRVVPAGQWLRNIRTHEPMPQMTWVFVGSEVGGNGLYIANVTGYLVTVVNFEYSVIDVPMLASSSNETLLWEYDPDRVPAAGTKVTMIITPADKVTIPAGLVSGPPPTSAPGAPTSAATSAPSGAPMPSGSLFP